MGYVQGHLKNGKWVEGYFRNDNKKVDLDYSDPDSNNKGCSNLIIAGALIFLCWLIISLFKSC